MPVLMNFSGGSTPAKKVLEIKSFAGIDLSSAPADIDKKRSPDAPNMMPDAIGNPVKRPGFDIVRNLSGKINGSFSLGEKEIIHAGKSLFVEGKEIWQGLLDERSVGIVSGNKLYIFDGLEALCFDGEHVVPLCDIAYIPTVLISKNADEAEKEVVLKGDGTSKEFILEEVPAEIISVTSTGTSKEAELSGDKIIFETAPEDGEEITIRGLFKQEPGGELKEEINLISDRWKESFLCDTGTEKKFTLSQKGLSFGSVKAFVMNDKGVFEEKKEGADFSVDIENGKVVFNEPIPKTPIVGTDNLIIEAGKKFDGYYERINHCSRGIAYDSGGTSNRIFLCGNPDEPNKDYWCAPGDPTYWPDTYYSVLANSESEIVGYSIIEGYLAAFISPALDGRSVVLRTSQLDENGNAVFPIVKHLQGEEAVAAKSFVFMEREPLFLTRRGVYAVTAEDVSGEKYTQNRSFYINKELCEEDVKNAFCTKWKQFYIISVPGKIYLLDTSQRSYQRGEPLSSFQYECYLWTDIEATAIWEKDGVLFFGDKEGNVCRFTEGRYSDDRKAIKAYWTIPDFFGDNFWRNKTIRTVAVQAAAFSRNVVRLEYRKDGLWNILKEWRGKISYFSWSGFSWADFTWSGNTTARTLTIKTKIKKFDKTAFRVVCDDNEKAFGLYGFALEYTESGRYKK